MKSITFLTAILLVWSCLYGQQTVLPSNTQTKNSDIDENIYRAGIYGIGSLSTQELQNANSAARLNFFIKPYVTGLFNFSFNKSATIVDTAIEQSILFPETGNSAVLARWEIVNFWPKRWEISGDNSFHSITPYFDFALQNSKNTLNDTIRSFSTLNYSAGFKYTWRLVSEPIVSDKEKSEISFSASVFYDFINVPNEDISDFRAILQNETISDHLSYFGMRFDIYFDQFNIFFTMRSGSTDYKVISSKGLQGFNSMIGTSINASLLKFKIKQ